MAHAGAMAVATGGWGGRHAGTRRGGGGAPGGEEPRQEPQEGRRERQGDEAAHRERRERQGLPALHQGHRGTGSARGPGGGARRCTRGGGGDLGLPGQADGDRCLSGRRAIASMFGERAAFTPNDISASSGAGPIVAWPSPVPGRFADGCWPEHRQTKSLLAGGRGSRPRRRLTRRRLTRGWRTAFAGRARRRLAGRCCLARWRRPSLTGWSRRSLSRGSGAGFAGRARRCAAAGGVGGLWGLLQARRWGPRGRHPPGFATASPAGLAGASAAADADASPREVPVSQQLVWLEPPLQGQAEPWRARGITRGCCWSLAEGARGRHLLVAGAPDLRPGHRLHRRARRRLAGRWRLAPGGAPASPAGRAGACAVGGAPGSPAGRGGAWPAGGAGGRGGATGMVC